MPNPRHRSAPPEPEAARKARFAHEADLIARARAQIAAGQVVTEEAFDDWVDSLGTPTELPPPRAATSGSD